MADHCGLTTRCPVSLFYFTLFYSMFMNIALSMYTLNYPSLTTVDRQIRNWSSERPPERHSKTALLSPLSLPSLSSLTPTLITVKNMPLKCCYSTGFQLSQADYLAGLSEAKTFHNLNLLPDPSLLLTTADIVGLCYVIMLG